MTDFPVGNVICESCNNMMHFSHQHSSDWIAVFYCNNPKCQTYGLLLRDNEIKYAHKVVDIESNSDTK